MSKKSIRVLENLAPRTQKNYLSTILDYEGFHGTSIDELIDEALMEQAENVPSHQLKIIDRIESYQEELVSRDYVYGTIQIMMTRIKSLYRKNRVVLPYLTPLNPKKIRRRAYIEYEDILTKEELCCAESHMRPPAQARLYVMGQCGLSSEECEHLTTREFIDDTYKYHQCNDDIKALEWLANEYNPIIWVVRLIRIKTQKPYYALISPEAVNKIAEAKLYELRLPKNEGRIPSKLLDTHKASFGRVCRKVNKICKFGVVAEEAKLRPHNLRRFHATHIKGSALTYEESSLTNSQIDEMQGRGKTSVQDTYIKTDKLTQKLLFAKVLNNVSLHHKYSYKLIDGDVVISIVDPTTENQKLKQEVQVLSSKLKKIDKNREKVNTLREELGEDVFAELVQGILNPSG